MTIMIVEDTAMMRRRLKEILIRDLNVKEEHITEVPNGHEAVKQYKQVNPDYVFLDIFMPGMNGVETMRQIKAMDAEAYVIMVTASASRRIVIESILAGAKDYIKKPPTLEKMARSLSIDLFNPQPKKRERTPELVNEKEKAPTRDIIEEIKNDPAFESDEPMPAV